MASPIADFVVSLGTDGRVQSQGTLSKVLAKDDKLAEELAEESEEIKKAENEVDHVDPDDEAAPPKADGKLVVAEEISEGHISWQARECCCVYYGADGSLTRIRQCVCTSRAWARVVNECLTCPCKHARKKGEK